MCNVRRRRLCQPGQAEAVVQFVVPQSGVSVELQRNAAPVGKVEEKVDVLSNRPPPHALDAI